jgi:hypothetical protein
MSATIALFPVRHAKQRPVTYRSGHVKPAGHQQRRVAPENGGPRALDSQVLRDVARLFLGLDTIGRHVPSEQAGSTCYRLRSLSPHGAAVQYDDLAVRRAQPQSLGAIEARPVVGRRLTGCVQPHTEHDNAPSWRRDMGHAHCDAQHVVEGPLHWHSVRAV